MIKFGNKLSLNKTHTLYLIIAVMFGTLFAYSTPPFMGLDEGDHFGRAYQIAHGGIGPDVVGNIVGGNVPSEVKEISDIVYSLRNQKDTDGNKEVKKKAYETDMSGNMTLDSFPGAAVYNPVPYVPAIIGYWLSATVTSNVGLTVLIMRLCGMAFFIGLVYASLYVVRKYRIKWVVFSIATFPLTIYQASTINADFMTIGFSLLIFAIIYKALQSKVLLKYEFILLTASVILLPLVKFNYIILSFLPLLLLKDVECDCGVYIKNYKKIAIIVPIIVSLIFTSAWFLFVFRYSDSINSSNGGVVAQLKFLITHPLSIIAIPIKTFIANGAHYPADYVFSMVSRMGFNSINLPIFVTVASWFMLMIATLYSSAEIINIKIQSLLMTVSGIIGAASVFAVLYLTFSQTGADKVGGMHGRYFLPVLPFMIVSLGLLGVAVHVKEKRLTYILGALTVVNLIVSVFYASWITFGLVYG